MEKIHIRRASVSGMFYSDNAVELRNSVDSLLQEAENVLIHDEVLRAVIVPHAGYVYSGEVAASAFVQIRQDAKYKRIILIGSSHHHRFKGVSVCLKKAYETPLGLVDVDFELANQLIKNCKYLSYHPEAHEKEHCLEVQLPFLQRRLNKKFKILPMIVGADDKGVIEEVANELQYLFSDDNLFVISTDFSHYPGYEDASRVDSETTEAILKNSPNCLRKFILDQKHEPVPGLVTNLCGWTAVLLFQSLSKFEKGLNYRPVLYQNSGDKLMRDHSRVVGYQSIVIIEKSGFNLSKQARKQLFLYARQGLYKYFHLVAEEMKLADYPLNEYLGAFVSVYVLGKLRGCIGTFSPNQPLKDLVQRLAVDAGIRDARFEELRREELNDLTLEISVLGPLKPISSIEEIEIGKHGIYVRHEFKSGTFLPAVAVRNEWTKDEFVSHCAKNKAGLTNEELKNAELFVYECTVVSEVEDDLLEI
ncbi:AmmeMemoRadiSam system protein B [Carboxylicivirga caseinilyticus]|uniref:AmmeMemoRadiSam system protein B n=1 Tax=Carboxylicivirga caseinilyticus TaxID=3417572 RepID=UPI003D3521A9|nr:AmmeMemoRadiSam system protein B [Marinilabiliaceae bacterium A049]